ncbi:MAG: hypothetical protein ACD_3C00188G0008 [uncultured bacterium (gcode 4)]|uniref:Uncharacterized protein n=1 Tax=uncultured bacterium (gcode 4) TaxID=1234023 RepID=K2G0A8_9BACT|nr:MAG: hypothetical protein ACD_3C00188G0008 [uncultured bacterium (gcode 4)]
MKTEQIVENDIIVRLQNSIVINDDERQTFLSLIMYFTPWEIEELKLMI